MKNDHSIREVLEKEIAQLVETTKSVFFQLNYYGTEILANYLMHGTPL